MGHACACGRSGPTTCGPMTSLRSGRRVVRLLTIMDEYTRECLVIRAERSIKASDVIETLAHLMVARRVPEHIRSDNGPEFTARAIREWLADVGAKTLYIEPGSPWENGYIESFNGKLRDELLDGEVFYTMTEVKVLTAQYRQIYNQVRPHSSIGYRPPAPETILPARIISGAGGTNITTGTSNGAAIIVLGHRTAGPSKLARTISWNSPRMYPMPKPGERRLFVLSRYPNGSYSSIGARGLLDIEGGTIKFATHEGHAVPFAVGKTSDEFLADVREKVSVLQEN